MAALICFLSACACSFLSLILINFSSSSEANMGSSAPVAIADVCDANSHLLTDGELRPLPPIFQIYGRKKVFSGPVVTVMLRGQCPGPRIPCAERPWQGPGD